MFFRKNLKTDFKSILSEKLDHLSKEGFFNIQLEKAIEESTKHAIQDLFGRYGKFGKSIEQALESQLNVDMRQIGLDGYNETVAKITKQLLDKYHIGPAQEEIKKTLEELFKSPPDKITVGEIVTEFYEHLREDFYDKHGNKPTVIIDQSTASDGYWHLYLDGKEHTQKYSCKYSMAFEKEGKCYAMKIGDQKIDRSLFLGNFYNFEKTLFRIYTAKVPVLIDGFDAYDIPYYGDEE